MSDGTFKLSLSLLFWLVLGLVVAAILLGAAGMPWLYLDLPGLVLVTVLIGLAVLLLCGGPLLYVWGKHYMSKG